jgi:hypothetical protein
MQVVAEANAAGEQLRSGIKKPLIAEGLTLVSGLLCLTKLFKE